MGQTAMRAPFTLQALNLYYRRHGEERYTLFKKACQVPMLV